MKSKKERVTALANSALTGLLSSDHLKLQQTVLETCCKDGEEISFREGVARIAVSIALEVDKEIEKIGEQS